MRIIRVIERRVLIQKQFDVTRIKINEDNAICNTCSTLQHLIVNRTETNSQSKQKRTIFRIKVCVKTSFNKAHGDEKFEVY